MISLKIKIQGNPDYIIGLIIDIGEWVWSNHFLGKMKEKKIWEVFGELLHDLLAHCRNLLLPGFVRFIREKF